VANYRKKPARFPNRVAAARRLPAGEHFTPQLVIPANTDTQLLGDGYRTRLLWKPVGPEPQQ